MNLFFRIQPSPSSPSSPSGGFIFQTQKSSRNEAWRLISASNSRSRPAGCRRCLDHCFTSWCVSFTLLWAPSLAASLLMPLILPVLNFLSFSNSLYLLPLFKLVLWDGRFAERLSCWLCDLGPFLSHHVRIRLVLSF